MKKLSAKNIFDAVVMYNNGHAIDKIGKALGVSSNTVWKSLKGLVVFRKPGHQVEHGMYGTPTYIAWRGMHARCNNNKRKDWKRYGGRGITICESWSKFQNFLKDMGPKPGKQFSLDRINNNGNYEPGNCRWATWSQQRKNASHARLITHNGVTMCINDWSLFLGGGRMLVSQRLAHGWSEQAAVTIPKLKKWPRYVRIVR